MKIDKHCIKKAEELLIENGVKTPFKIILPRKKKRSKQTILDEVKKLKN